MVASGIQNKHARVRWEALMSMGMLINELSPVFQTKFSAELVPVLVGLSRKEAPRLKMQTLVTSVISIYIRGLVDEENGEYSDQSQLHRKIIFPYADQIVQCLSEMLQLSINENY